jgi:transposase
MIIMLKAYKFRLYPTKSQRTKMERTLDLCRWTYNQTLAYRKNAWEKEQRSIMCSRCGTLVEKSLSERVHNCPCCGLSMDRDQNAAINILRLGMQSLRRIDRSPDL